jgi:hypothetical protein
MRLLRRNSGLAGTAAALFAATLISMAAPAGTASAGPNAPSALPVITVFATGFNNPRGLRFGPDGNLYVAEGGIGGAISTAGPPPLCEQAAGVGPYTGSFDGARISKVDTAGHRTTFASGFPSSQTAIMGGLVSGVADVAFIDGTMYALIAGAGCSHGLEGTFNGVAKVDSFGNWTMIANLSQFQMDHPVAHPNPGDFEPDGTWYSMVAVRGALYAVEPNHGEVDRIGTDGTISRVVDISATYGHIVPTAIAYHGNFYVGNLNTFDPIGPLASKVYKITPSGQIKIDTDGVALVTGLAFDQRGRMYVLELGTDPSTFNPFTGQIVRVDPSGRKQVIVSNANAPAMFFPTGMTFGPDGNLYVSSGGFGLPPILPEGLGTVLKVDLTD